MMNKEKFDKIIQSLMNKEIEINHLLNHLNQTQLETSFQLTNGSPTIEDKVQLKSYKILKPYNSNYESNHISRLKMSYWTKRSITTSSSTS